MLLRYVLLLLTLSRAGGQFHNWADPPDAEDASLIYICESFPAGEEVMTLFAGDNDGDNLTFSIHENSTDALRLFEVVGKVLKVRDNVTDELDFEGETPLRDIPITLVVTDAENTTAIDCLIKNEDDNDHTPEYTQATPFTTTIPDTLYAGDQVFQVQATDGDGTEENSQIIYSLKDDLSTFTIGGDDGKIYLTANVTAGENFTLTVIASDSNPECPLSAETTLTVTVGHMPVWIDPAEGEEQKVYLCESFENGTVVMELLAGDPDNDDLTFSIDTDNSDVLASLFEIVYGNKLAIKADIDVSKLDYEGVDPFRTAYITLLVSDGVYDPKPIVAIFMNEDDNDHEPMFSGETPFSVTIFETAASGYQVFQVQASDGDGTEENSKIVYSLEDDLSTFTIDAEYGTIYLTANVTAGQNFTLSVIASDSNPECPLSAETTLTVTVVEQQLMPVWIDPAEGGDQIVYLCESFESATVVMELLAEDLDNDDLTFSIDNYASDVLASLLEIIDGNKLAIKADIDVAAKLDYEGDDPFRTANVTLLVSDGVFDPVPIVVILKNEDNNDHEPMFLGGNAFNTTIFMTASPGDQVFQVQATDRDGTEENSKVVYRLKDDLSKFTIDAEYGTIYLTANVTAGQNFTLTVIASDSNPECPLSAEATLTVTVGQQMPVWIDPAEGEEQKVYMCESFESGTVVIELLADDPDNDNLTFNIDNDISDVLASLLEIIDGNRLAIKADIDVAAKLDYEGNEPFRTANVTLLVSDGVFDPVPIVVTFKNEDNNDHEPMFLGGNAFNTTIFVTASPGDHVFQVQATDGDGTEENSNIVYRLKDDLSTFAIDAEYGTIYLTAYVTAGQIFTLTVIASDSNPECPLSTEATVIVSVGQLMPIWIDPAEGEEQKVYMCESFESGTVVIKLLADDPDSDNLTFSIDNDSSDVLASLLEIIDGNKLAIKADIDVTAKLDYEGNDPFRTANVTLLVSDGVFDPVPIVVTFKNEDNNDHEPMFLGGNAFNTTIFVTASPGDHVFQVQATDGDGTEENSNIVYRLKDDLSTFAIDAEYGTIYLTAYVTAGQNFTLTVIASDSNPECPLSTEATVVVSVGQLMPVWIDPAEGEEQKVYMCESFESGTVVIKLLADDPDSDNLAFSIDNDNSDVLASLLEIIDGNKLAIKADIDVTAKLDYEGNDPFRTANVTLLVSDGVFDPVPIVVTFKNEDNNDHEPMFLGGNAFNTTIFVTASPGDHVFQVQATDGDGTEENSNIVYRLKDDLSTFAIDAEYGTIYLTAYVTAGQNFTLTVIASDSNPECPLSTEATVIVSVGQLMPIWIDPAEGEEQKVYMCESFESGTVVIKLLADDPDSDNLTFSIDNDISDVLASLLEIIDGNKLAIKADIDVTAKLDYEGNDPFRTANVTLLVSDGVFDPVPIVVTFKNEDNNDHEPMFLGGNAFNTTIFVTASPGDHVFQVQATDGDGTEENSNIVYKLKYDLSTFVIDAEYGTIYLTAYVTAGQNFTLTVIASDSNPECPLSTEATVVVSVGQLMPVWIDPAEGEEQKVYMCESFENGTVMIELHADDPDSDILTYSIDNDTSDSLASLLKIVDGNKLAISADIDVTAKLDFEGVNPFRTANVTLMVSDGVFDPVPIVVILMNEDDNDLVPMFSGETPFDVTILMTASSGDKVFQVEATDGDGTEENSKIIYSLKDNLSMFTISPEDGSIYLTASVSAGDKYTLTVIASDSNPECPLSAETNLTVTVGHMPVWIDPTAGDAQNIYLCESFLNGTVLMELRAEDSDNDDLIFSIDTDNSDEIVSLFEIIYGNKLAIRGDADVAKLDFEGDTPFIKANITLLVSDGLHNPVPIVCKLNNEDDNDNRPKYSPEPPYTAMISESSSSGISVFQAFATDDDGSEENSNIIYSLSGDEAAKFSVDSSGLITLADNVTLVEGSVLELVIIASDSNPECPLSTEANLTVIIQEAPVFVHPNPDDDNECKIYICETAEAKDSFLTFAATDEDTDVADLKYNIDASNDEAKAIFVVDGKDLKVQYNVTEHFFDYETRTDAARKFPIVVEVSDGHTAVNLNTFVCIEDSNDHAPVFEGPFEKLIEESTAAGTKVIDITVTDADGTSDNNQVTLTMSASEMFELNADATAISIKDGAKFDVTAPTDYNVIVTATDNGGEHALTTNQTYTITVGTAPIFYNLKTARNESIDENIDDNEIVFTLQITDKDGEGPIRVSIESESENAKGLFRLDGTLVKKAINSVDFDAETSVGPYYLTFRMTDQMFEVTSEMISFTIKDVNDNKPVFTKEDTTVEIAESSKKGFLVTTISATDADISNPDNVMIYSLSGDGSDDFSIDNDGKVTVARELKFANQSEYSLTVTAEDSQVNPLSETTSLTIKLKTAADITNPENRILYIEEVNTAKLALITELSAIDEDGDTVLTFRIVSQSPQTDTPMFSIIENNKLVIEKKVDAEAENAILQYNLTLEAVDQQHFTPERELNVTVNILDTNEPPMFDKAEYRIEILELTAVGTPILSVTASDKDITEIYRTLQYILASENGDHTQFSVNRSTGEIYVEKPLDYDLKNSYIFNLVAVDGSIDPLSGAVQVTVTVATAPKFVNLQEVNNTEVDENSMANKTVFELNVVDKDEKDEGSTVDITILSQMPDEMFELDGAVLKTKTDGLDAEESGSYKIVFNLTDGTYSTIAEVTVLVIDKNDESPQFTAIGNIVIEETKPITGIESDIIVVQAQDGDATSPNNQMTFEITGGNLDDYFAINSETGMLSLKKRPVSMTVNEHILTIKVVDGGTPPNEATTNVTIVVNGDTVIECATSPCQNDAMCTSNVNSYLCECVLGFNGTNCENNIDDCTPNPCLSGGECTDGVNSFTCNCPEGLTGETCNNECTNNKYGSNCEKPCDCDSSKLRRNVGAQTCHFQTGHCFCNDFLEGKKCDSKINECERNNTLCSSKPKQICHDIDEGFTCLCEQGYEENSGACTAKAPVTVVIENGKFGTLLEMELETGFPCDIDFRNPIKHQEQESIISALLERQLLVLERSYIHTIRCGSIIFNATIVANDSENDRAVLAKAIQDMRDAASLDLGGRNVTATSILVETKEVLPSSQMTNKEEAVCSVFTGLGACASGTECRYEDGLASCKSIQEVSNNLTLFLGLGFGVLLPLLLALIVVVIVVVKKWKDLHKRKQRKWKVSESTSDRTPELPTRYYDNARYSNSSLDGIKGYYGMPTMDVVKYERQDYRY